jgi:hypothetical protein
MCSSPQRNCGGTCADIRFDRDHCGGCGMRCPYGAQCFLGVCCPLGLEPCLGRCVDVLSDPWNCGVCGLVCPGRSMCWYGGCVAY